MTKKFKEEQYQKIVKAWRSENTYVHQTEAVIDYLIDDLNVDVTLMGDVAIALANPVTREWAHDQFVEKEKKYYWKRNGLYLTKDNFDGSIIFDSYKSLFTESEIVFWGYNPEMFDREEV